MIQINRYVFKLEVKWVKDLGYVRSNGQWVIRELLNLPDHWDLQIRYRNLDPFTISEDTVTVDVFARTDMNPTGKRHYCQLWVPYKLEQQTNPRWKPPTQDNARNILGRPNERYGREIPPSQLVWDGTNWLYMNYPAGVSTCPHLLTVEFKMLSLYDLFKDKLTDRRTPFFISVDAGYQWDGDEWVLAKEPKLDV